MSWCQNGIRQFLAIAIIMAGFPLLLKRKYVPLTVIIPVRGNVPCVSASYGTDYLYCAGESME